MSETEYSAAELGSLVLYADNHLLAVGKPAGLLSQDSGTGLRNLEDWAREWVRVDKNKEGNVFLNAVHRIDKVVSGVVLFARTSKALSRLNEDVRKRNCKKIYHALVEGVPERSSAELVHWLSHEHHCAEVCREGDKGAQRAVLRYRTLQQIDKLTLLEVDLETGRYHQIRAQLASIGCPIAGDERYGARLVSDGRDIALHHFQLEINHPTTREAIVIKAPYPAGSGWWSQVPAS
ncbi:MAG: RNA pseudouridine synthase [Verrucomicrobiota bacterium]